MLNYRISPRRALRVAREAYNRSVTEEHQRQVATFIRNVTDVSSVEVETFCSSARKRRYSKDEDFGRVGERYTEILSIHRGAFRYYLLVTIHA